MTNRYFKRPGRPAGFTLIELMVVLTVSGILVSLALAGYGSSVRKSRRTEAKTALLDLAGREERVFSTTNAYSTSPTALGYSASATTFGAGVTVGSGYYLVTVTQTTAAAAGTPATFTATATATGTQVADTACATYQIDQLGNQTAATSGGADNTKTCWQ